MLKLAKWLSARLQYAIKIAMIYSSVLLNLFSKGAALSDGVI